MSAGGRERSCRPRRRSSGCAPTRWSTPNAGSKPASPSGCWTASITCSASISRRASSTTVGPEPARDPCGHREPPGDLSRTATRDDSETVNFRGMGRTLGQIWASSPWPKSRGPSVPISRTTAWRRSSHPLQGSAASPHRLVQRRTIEGRFDDESRCYSVIITVSRDSARMTVIRRESGPSWSRELGAAAPSGSHCHVARSPDRASDRSPSRRPLLRPLHVSGQFLAGSLLSAI